MTCLLVLSLLSLTAQAAPQEVLEPFSIDAALTPPTSCNPPAEAQSPIPVACLPDPFEQLCITATPEIEKLARDTEARAQQNAKNFDRFFDEGIASAEKNVGSLRKKHDFEFGRRYFRHAWNHVRESFTRGTEAKVKGVVLEAMDVFLETLKNSPILTADEKKDIEAVLRRCTDKPVLDVSTVGSRNASVELNTEMKAFLRELSQDAIEEGRYVHIHPRAGMGCALGLSDKQWMDCVDRNPLCFEVLFHEFGHILNSCNFLSMAHESSRIKAGLQQDDSNPLAFAAMRRALKISEEEMQSLGNALVRSTDCLSTLSEPKDPLPNDCDLEGKIPAPFKQRCGAGSLEKFPTQWREAEADFWGASALANWVKKLPNQKDRNDYFNSIAAQWCLEERAGFKSNRTSKPLSQKGQQLIREYNELMNSQKQACEATPSRTLARPLPQPWIDPHQSLARRFNRNYLRNSDLRDALGCGYFPGQITESCSPRGVRKRLIPSP